MKRYFPLFVLLILTAYFSTTGFQCGSTELTSARLYIQQKQMQKAEESLMREVQKNPKNEEAWFLLGQVRMEGKRYLEMNEAFTRGLEAGNTYKTRIDTIRIAVWGTSYNAGVLAYNKGKDSAQYFDKAIDNFKTAIVMAPDTASTYYVCALPYLGKKDYPNAIAMLETSLKKNPKNSDAARLLGQVHYMIATEKKEAKDDAGAAAEYQKATAAYETAYNADPRNVDNIVGLIEAYERSNKSDKALALTRDAVEKDPTNAMFHYAYGVFLLKQDKFEESIEQFKKTLELDPKNADATYNCGVAYLNWGVTLKAQADKAAEATKKGTKMKETKEEAVYKGKFKDALPYLEASSNLREDDAAFWQQLARLYANLNMVDKSKAAFEKVDKLMNNK
jgi:tetratricopeptide (TPR) repeat protein